MQSKVCVRSLYLTRERGSVLPRRCISDPANSSSSSSSRDEVKKVYKKKIIKRKNKISTEFFFHSGWRRFVRTEFRAEIFFLFLHAAYAVRFFFHPHAPLRVYPTGLQPAISHAGKIEKETRRVKDEIINELLRQKEKWQVSQRMMNKFFYLFIQLF